MKSIHFVVPAGIDDATRPSGGNRYDRRVIDGLLARGWAVRVHEVDGPALAKVLAAMPSNAVVLIDGLIASASPDQLGRHARRLRLVILLHMALGTADEAAALSAARAVITTSEWLRHRVVALYGEQSVAVPGVDRAPLAVGSASGGNLLCVAAVAAHKGHDVLISALATVADRRWRCTCVGSLERDTAFVARVRAQVEAAGIAERVSFIGPLMGDALARAYAEADVLVLASRGESYGMVITEALAAGVPVIATAVGGVPEALGAPGAGLLVAPDDPVALGVAVRRWLDDAELRQSLRRGAAARRLSLPSWDETVHRVAAALSELSEPVAAS